MREEQIKTIWLKLGAKENPGPGVDQATAENDEFSLSACFRAIELFFDGLDGLTLAIMDDDDSRVIPVGKLRFPTEGCDYAQSGCNCPLKNI